jgi:hypothetical protein
MHTESAATSQGSSARRPLTLRDGRGLDLMAASGQIPVAAHMDPPGMVSLCPDSRAGIVETGCSDGPVRVRVVELTGEPASVDETADWEDIVEVSLSSPGSLSIISMLGEQNEDLLDVTPSLTGEWYRMRVRTPHGRTEMCDLGVDEACEDYLIQVWVGQRATSAVLRSPSR